MIDYTGKRITVVGLGIEGQDLVRFFANRGARVTVSDAKPVASLRQQLANIADLNVTLSLGANLAEDADGADLVAVTQGAPLDLPPILRARERGIPVTSLTQLFLDLCPGRIIGISGSSGKTTTTSMVGAIMDASGQSTVMGGNIGRPLLNALDSISQSTWVVLEVSHSQLVLTNRSPHVACLTNVTPNHLDRFSWGDYVALKRNLIAHQLPQDIAVLNHDNAITRLMNKDTRASVHYFSITGEIKGDGAFLRGDRIVLRENQRETAVMSAGDVPLRGRHNLENAVCASAIAGACGVHAEVIAEAVRRFKAVPHRLEVVGEAGGASYYNDSIATTPERTLAGIRSFQEPLVLLLGGRDKHLPLEELATEVNRRCRAVLCFGEAGNLLASGMRSAHRHGVCQPSIRRVATLDEAVEAATRLAQPGDVVLLSPACTSFDAYENFEQRGEAFRALVRRLASQTSGPSRNTLTPGKESQPSHEA